MIQVHTRDGIFGPGGYGGGLFDGSNMGFGGMGDTGCGDSSTCGIAGLTAPTQWTIGPNEWPSTVSQAVVKSTTRWKELPSANPGMKLVTINGQANLSPWKVGQIVNLPASWVPQAAPAPAQAPAGGAGPMGVDATDWQFGVKAMQGILNQILDESGYETIGAPTGTLTAATLGAFKLVSTLTAVASASKIMLSDMVNEVWPTPSSGPVKFAVLLQAAAGAVPQPWPTPAKASAPPGPQPAPSTAEDCKFVYGSAHGQLKAVQLELNTFLDAQGYQAIPVTGVYDAATCGAIFSMKGFFKPTPSALCPDGWEVPFECPGSFPPKKKGEPTPPHEKTSTSMAWMLGGLIGAAAIAGLYVSMKKK